MMEYKGYGAGPIGYHPATDIARPVAPRTINSETIDTLTKRIGPDMTPIPVGHLVGEKLKNAKPAGEKRK